MKRLPGIVADTSSFPAILLNEEDAEQHKQTLLKTEKILISSATLIEITSIDFSKTDLHAVLSVVH